MKTIPTLIHDGITTLPLYRVVLRLKGDLPAFGSGEGEVQPPSAEDLFYDLPIVQIPRDQANGPTAAIYALEVWQQHHMKYAFRSQFVDDENSQKYAALQQQTKLLSRYLETEQSVDTSVLFESIELVKDFADIHSQYRRDKNRDEHRNEYIRRLESAWSRYFEKQKAAILFAQRMQVRLSALAVNDGDDPAKNVDALNPRHPRQWTSCL
jgi:hypothetical protein